MGRPTKYSPERAAKICEGLRVGMTRGAACAYAAISIDAFLRWIKSPTKANFATAVAQAEREAEAKYTAVLAKAAQGYDVVKKRVVRRPVRLVRSLPDGGKEEYIGYEEEVMEETAREFDWRAAESWLKRRNARDWSERKEPEEIASAPTVIQQQALEKLDRLLTIIERQVTHRQREIAYDQER